MAVLRDILFVITEGWIRAAPLAETVFIEDTAVHWQHFHGSSTIFPNGKSRTGMQ